MNDFYVTTTIKRDGKLVLRVTCDQFTIDDGFLWDILDSYTIPCYEITIKTEEGEDESIS